MMFRQMIEFASRSIHRVGAVPALIAACALIVGCGNAYGPSGGGTPPPPPDPLEIDATPSLVFNPRTRTVNAGATVKFVFGSVAHNVFFDATAGAPADITGSNMGVSIDRTFPTAGTYVYRCHIHPGMTGTVVVQTP